MCNFDSLYEMSKNVPSMGGFYDAVIFCVIFEWFYMLTFWNMEKNFVWIFDEDVITVWGSSGMYCSCWDGERICFSKNCAVTFTVDCINDNQKLCKNRNTDRHQEQNVYCKKVSKSSLQFLLMNNRKNDNLCGRTIAVENVNVMS